MHRPRFLRTAIALCITATITACAGQSHIANTAAQNTPPFANAVPLAGELRPYALALRPSHVHDLAAFGSATRYEIELWVNPTTRSIRGVQSVRYTNRGPAPLDEIMLRLYPNTRYMNGSMQAGAVLADGRPVTPTVYLRASIGAAQFVTDSSVVRLPLPARLGVGQSVTLSMTFQVTAPARPETGYRVFGQTNGVLSLPNVYPLIPPRDSRGAWHLDEAPDWGDIVFSESALYRVRIQAPIDQVIVASGVCTSFRDAAHARQEVTCVAGPLRDFALHLSEKFEVIEATLVSQGELILLRSYYLSGFRAGAARA
ncbi:MAG: hypothetical protein RMN25_14580, partial [Anaerolineae bacterium]|nr:hypothetical protein [Thermoflexales bacterium]MDW8408997.1 hypothetical protein [Anaerolineae bacterium]